MFKKITLSLTFIYIAYVLLSFSILPSIIKSQISSAIVKNLDAKLSIETLFFNPFSFELSIDGLSLKTLDDRELVSLKRLEVDLEPLSLIFLSLHIKEISLTQPQIFLSYDRDQNINFSKIVKDKPSQTEQKSDLRVIVDSFNISRGSVHYVDLTKESVFELSSNEIEFRVKNIDTQDLKDAHFRFNTILSDESKIDIRGDINSIKPLKIESKVSLDSLKIYTLWRYIKDNSKLEVADGELDLSSLVSLDFNDLNAMTLQKVDLNLQDLRIKPKDKNSDILTLKEFQVKDALLKPMMKQIHIETLILELLKVDIARDENRELEWLKYLNYDENSAEPKEEQKPWSVRVNEILLKNLAFILADESIKPTLKTQLQRVNAEIKEFELFGDKKIPYKMEFVLNDKSVCKSSGDVKLTGFELQTYAFCKDLDIAHYRPYIEQVASDELKSYDILLKSLTTSFDANILIKDDNSKMDLLVNRANISFNDLLSASRVDTQKLVNFKALNFKDLNFNSKTKDLSIEKISLDALDLNLKKHKDKTLNFDNLIEVKPAIQKEQNEQKEYRVKVGTFDLNGAKVDFLDESREQKAEIHIDKIDLRAKELDSKQGSSSTYDLLLRVNSSGAIRSSGEVRHTPFEQSGELHFDKISLKELTPYLEEMAFLKISDGYLSLNSKTRYKQAALQADLNIDGTLKVEEFFLHDSRDNSTIASFSKADLKLFSFESLSNSLLIDEAHLDSFYLDAIIDENKSINLSKLLKPKEQLSQKIADDTNSTAFNFKLLKLQVEKGSANFADYSLPLDFKTSIHDLYGTVYALSNKSGEVAYVDIKGEVDEYGATKLNGSFELSNIRSYMDIDFNFRNLELSSLSGYSAQFAGYKIAKGKLFLDLKYGIKDSFLNSNNSVTIKNIELGDEIEDENITKLPLGFAIALLENSDGLITIDMPIEGDIDKPDFKYGTIMLKAFSNLIVKAVTSPFTFLGKLFGVDPDMLKGVDFEAGEASILPPEREKLDNLTNILLRKPKLTLAIEPSYDKDLDLEALKAKKLKQRVLELSKQEHPTSEILEQIYLQLGGNIDSLKNELVKKMQKGFSGVEYQKELYSKCVDMQSILGDELRDLAQKRAFVIREYLVVSNKMNPDKITIQETQILNKANEKYVVSELKIEVK